VRDDQDRGEGEKEAKYFTARIKILQGINT